MGNVSNIWRHPIKGVGCEPLTSVSLQAGKTMPWDRHWAIAHTDAKFNYDSPEWARCINFARGARGHRLMAVMSNFDETTGQMTLTHPDLSPISINPDTPNGADILVEWLTKISDPKRSLPHKLVKVDGHGMTDSSTQSLSIYTNASLREFSKTIGADLDQRRFRGNIWLDGFNAWDEFSWIGRKIKIGTAEFEITKPVERCVATTVNPDTGIADQETLKTLRDNWDHQDFGVFGVVTKSGEINTGDEMELI